MFLYASTPETRSALACTNEMVVVLFSLVFLGAFAETRVAPWAGNLAVFAGLLLYSAYLALSVSLLGGTIARRLIGVRVQTVGGGRATITQGFVRTGWVLAMMSLTVGCAPVGIVLGVLGRRPGKRWWHDHRAGTEIVDEPNRLRR